MPARSEVCTALQQVQIASLKDRANQAALVASRCFAELGKQQCAQGDGLPAPGISASICLSVCQCMAITLGGPTCSLIESWDCICHLLCLNSKPRVASALKGASKA